MNENQRLKSLMDLLYFKTQKDFATALNIKQGSLSDILRERVNVSNAIKDKLELKFDVNLTWLENGTGEPFFKKKPGVNESKEGVPYFDMSLSDAKDFLVEEQRAEYLVNYLLLTIVQPIYPCMAIACTLNMPQAKLSPSKKLLITKFYNGAKLMW